MLVTADGVFEYLTELDQRQPPLTKHDGCAYSTVECRSKGCKPAELCPAGHQVYRNWTGGGHHHEDTE